MASAFSEKYVRSGGSNLNGGSSDADAAAFSFTSGDWVAATGVFTAAGADLSTVTVGQDASVFVDGATVGVFCGRVTAKDDGADTITVSLVAKSGTPPVDGTGNRSIRVGGAWKGPNGAEDFPFDFVESTQTNAAADPVRVNLKSGTNYAITAAVAHSKAGPIRFQGYTTTPGDGGKAIIDGTIVGASYVLLTITGANTDLCDLIFQNNGTTGSAAGLTINAADAGTYDGLVVHDVRGHGFNIAQSCVVTECEAYLCNTSNTANTAGFNATAAGTTLVRCVAHDNAGSNSTGFRVTNGIVLQRPIADTNGKFGIEVTSAVPFSILDGSIYNNGSDGIAVNAASAVSLLIENCILTRNVGDGIDLTGAARNGVINNCAFGAGTEANGGTIVNLSGVLERGTITLGSDVDPFSAPSTGNFNVTAAAVKGTGRGTFTETQASYTGTVGYPDVGASQHQESASAGIIGSLLQNPLLST